MSTFYQTNTGKGVHPMPIGAESEELAVRVEFDLSAALVLNDIIEMLVLPADHVIRDWIVDSDDLDSNGAPTIAFNAGIMSGTPGTVDLARTVGTEIMAADVLPQAGGVKRPTVVGAFRVAPASTDRSIGIKVSTGPATGAATGKVGITLMYSPARYGA
ncbi:MAG: hypothetical protein ACYC9K_00920 [Sulfuricaulis sp.]